MPDSTDLELRVLDLNKDKSESLRLMQAVYGEGSEVGNSVFYDWQYFDNPVGQAIVAGFFTKKSNRLVSQVASIPTLLVVEGKRAIYYMTLNIATDPEFRGLHLMSSLFRFIHKKFDEAFTYGMPNANSLSLHERVGYSVLEIPALFRLIRPTKLISERFKTSIFDKVMFRPDREVMKSVELMKESFPKETDVIPAGTRSAIFHERNTDYLDWRFRKIPTRKYSLLSHKNDRSSYLIGRSIPDKHASVVCELQANDQGVAKELLNAFCALSYDANDTSMIFTGFFENNAQYKYAKSAGFRSVPQKLRPHPLALCVYPLETSTQPDPRDLNNWFFSLGDFDVF